MEIKKRRKKRIIKVYDNWIGERYQLKGDKNGQRRAIDEIEWIEVIDNGHYW